MDLDAGVLIFYQAIPQRRMAWCYTQYAKRDWCAQSQLHAQSAKIGLWVNSKPTLRGSIGEARSSEVVDGSSGRFGETR